MISAWDIYWVMMLDSIGCTLSIFAIVGSLVGGVAAIVHMMAAGDNEPSIANGTRWGKPLLFIALAAFFINMLIPDTKTAAMMVVIPRVANNPNVQREAGELYDIAKTALRKLAAPEPKKE